MSPRIVTFRIAAFVGWAAAATSALAGLAGGAAAMCAPKSTQVAAYGTVWGIPAGPLALLWFSAALAAAAGPPRRTPRVEWARLGLLNVLALLAPWPLFQVARQLFAMAPGSYCWPCLTWLVCAAGVAILVYAGPGALVAGANTRPGRPRFAIAGGLASLAGILVGVWGVSLGAQRARSSPALPNLASTTAAESWLRAQARQPLSRPDLQLSIVAFYDYQCPFCRKAFEHYEPVFRRLQQRHPNAVGVDIKDLPLDSACNDAIRGQFHPLACRAAVAVRLASAAGQGESMRAWLFANQSSLTAEALRSAARQRGVSDLDSAQVVEDVRRDINLARTLRVNGTPTIFANGVALPMGVSAAAMARLLEAELQLQAVARRPQP